MKKVLIAHQSTVPHYRVPFYNALERLRPDTWRFDVVFDPKELSSPRFFNNPLDIKQFQFPILTTNTLTVRVCRIMVSYQTFWSKAAQYDLIIVGRALNNITYPLCQLHQIMGRKVAYWGHDRDRKAMSPARWKRWAEQSKIWSAQMADGFFAYTPAVKRYLTGQGVPAAKIFVINNTIDIQEQRSTYQKYAPHRERIRRDLGLTHKKVLLFVGRFSPNKRLDFLVEAFAQLQKWDDNFHLLLVGEGQKSYAGLAHVTCFGPVIDLETLGPIYVASDVFVMTGAIGLAPLQALCFDLACMVLDWPANGPEFEYLSPSNGVILAADTTPDEYAKAIVRLFDHEAYLAKMRMNAWASIQHLTIEAMAQNFIEGINTLLEC